MRRLKLLEQSCDKQCVFLSIVCHDMQPYKKHYPEGKVSGILTIKRHEGTIGFLGGKVDPGETLVTALVREVWEEGNIDISNYTNSLTPICSHHYAGADIHHFTLNVSREEMKNMVNRMVNGKSFGEEITGFAVDLVHPKTIDNLMDNNYKATARFEMQELIDITKEKNYNSKLDW